MTSEEFNNLKVGDRFKFHGVVYEVAKLEDYKISPTEHDLYSITTTSGNRAIRGDADIQEFVLCP